MHVDEGLGGAYWEISTTVSPSGTTQWVSTIPSWNEIKAQRKKVVTDEHTATTLIDEQNAIAEFFLLSDLASCDTRRQPRWRAFPLTPGMTSMLSESLSGPKGCKICTFPSPVGVVASARQVSTFGYIAIYDQHPSNRGEASHGARERPELRTHEHMSTKVIELG